LNPDDVQALKALEQLLAVERAQTVPAERRTGTESSKPASTSPKNGP
jgi:hypothetical protein